MKKTLLLGISSALILSSTLLAQTAKNITSVDNNAKPTLSIDAKSTFLKLPSKESTTTTNSYSSSKANKTFKTSANPTKYKVSIFDAMVALGALNSVTLTGLWPDSLVQGQYTNATSRAGMAEITPDTNLNVQIGVAAYSFGQLFDPRTELFNYAVTGNNINFGNTSDRKFIMDSVTFAYSYIRYSNPSIVDTMEVYVVNSPGGVGNGIGFFTGGIPTIFYQDTTNNAPSSFFKKQTILLNSSDTTDFTKIITGAPTEFPSLSISLDSMIIDPTLGEYVGILVSYKPGQTYSDGDTLFSFTDTTFTPSLNRLFLYTHEEGNTGSLTTPNFDSYSTYNSGFFSTMLQKYPSWFFPTPLNYHFNSLDFSSTPVSPVSYRHLYTEWSVAPVGVALTVSGGGTGVDCRTLTFLANDNFNANKWTWNFGDGTPNQITYTNTVMHTYTSPSASIPVTCTAEDTTLAKTFVANASTPILQFCTAAGIEESTLGASVGLYPNPATKSLNININSTDAQDLNVAIVDILGVSVYVNTLNNVINYNNTIDVDHLASGVYFVKVSNDKGAIIKKLIVE